MQKVIFITGLPGSGKSTYLANHQEEFGDALVCDDYYKSATVRPRKSLEFEGSAYYEDVKTALGEGRNVVIADILFCENDRLEEAKQGLQRLLTELNIKAEIDFRFFENDRAACIENIHHRNRPDRVPKELAFIDEVADQYKVPVDVEPISVYKR